MPETDDDFPIVPHLLPSEEEIVKQMIIYYKEEYEGKRSPISDFFEGSQIRNILASTSIEGFQLRWLINFMLKMGYVRYARGGWLDILGLEFNIPRYSSVHSRGQLLFTYDIDDEVEDESEENTKKVNATLYDPIIIPAYTTVAPSKNDLEYETLEDVVILPGTSVTVFGQCGLGGEQGNISRGKIDSIIDDNDELWDLTVINPEPFTGGKEEEEDEPYRARIQNRQKELERVGTLDWYKSRAEDVEGVLDAVVINQAVGPYTVGLIINGTQKPTSDELVDKVRDWFYQRNNLIGGMDVIVKKVNEKPVNFQITGTVAKGQNTTMVNETTQDDLRCLVNGGTTSTGIKYSGMGIGETLHLTQIYGVLMALNNILPSWYVTVPSIEIFSRSDEVLVFGDCNILL